MPMYRIPSMYLYLYVENYINIKKYMYFTGMRGKTVNSYVICIWRAIHNWFTDYDTSVISNITDKNCKIP